jgi:hypothetical protein
VHSKLTQRSATYAKSQRTRLENVRSYPKSECARPPRMSVAGSSVACVRTTTATATTTATTDLTAASSDSAQYSCFVNFS